jgi:uncharacterized OB-fold protein
VSLERPDAGFFAGLGQGELRLPRCGGCARWTWPAAWRCGACGAWTFEWEAVAPLGTVYSFVRTHHAFRPELRTETPYVSVLVSLDGAAGVRLLGRLIGPEQGLKIGAPVLGFIDTQAGGDPVLRWRLLRGTGR